MLTKIVLKPRNYSTNKSFLFYVIIVFGTNASQIFCYFKYYNDFWEAISQAFKYIGFFLIWFLINSIYVSSGFKYNNFISFLCLIFIVFGINF